MAQRDRLGRIGLKRRRCLVTAVPVRSRNLSHSVRRLPLAWGDRRLPLPKTALYGSGLLLLFLWDWQLSLSLTLGAGATLWLYRLQRLDWARRQQQVQRWLRGRDRRWLLAAGGGGLVSLALYTSSSIWTEEGRPWLAFSNFAETIGLLALAALLVGFVSQQQQRDREGIFDQALATLTAADPLQRLLAVRSLQRLQEQQLLEPSEQRLLQDAILLLLRQETEDSVRELALNLLDRRSDRALMTAAAPQPLQLNARTTTAETISAQP